jgi:small subunit ribosomal protein S2e
MADKQKTEGRPQRSGDKGGEAGGRGGDKKGFGRGKDDKKGGAPKSRGGPIEEEWIPVTKLGRLVQSGAIKKIEEIYRFSIPIKESQIVDLLLKDVLKEEVMKISPVQKQTTAGQRTRFKAMVLVGDCNGHLGLGIKVAKEVQGAIKGAIMDAKLNMIPIRRGYWGNKIEKPHTVPVKITGKGGSVRVRLVPAPRGCGIVAAPATKKVLQLAGIQDVYTDSIGNTKTRFNFLKATFDALAQTYRYLTPDLWRATKYEPTILERNNAK